VAQSDVSSDEDTNSDDEDFIDNASTYEQGDDAEGFQGHVGISVDNIQNTPRRPNAKTTSSARKPPMKTKRLRKRRRIKMEETDEEADSEGDDDGVPTPRPWLKRSKSTMFACCTRCGAAMGRIGEVGGQLCSPHCMGPINPSDDEDLDEVSTDYGTTGETADAAIVID